MSSGASSDIISATQTASAMVKVCIVLQHFRNSGLHFRLASDGVFLSLAQYSMTIGTRELVKSVRRK